MNVFVTQTCYRQVFGGTLGNVAARIDDFNRVVERLQLAGSRADLMVKGLGTKKYRNVAGDVYGIDLNNGLTAERLVFKFIDPDDLNWDVPLSRYFESGQVESVLLCRCSAHDDQDRAARSVARAQTLSADVASVHEHTDVPHVVEELPWRVYTPRDLQRYGRPRTPVLTSNKFRIVGDFLQQPGSMLVTGSAGSGKTELGLAVACDFVRGCPDVGAVRVLYTTASARLLSQIEDRCPSDVLAHCSFMTYETLLRRLLASAGLRFSSSRQFAAFASTLRSRPAMGGKMHDRMVALLDRYGEDCVYTELYSTVGGCMGASWDRDLAADPFSAYLGLPDSFSSLNREERPALAQIARSWASWVRSSSRKDANEAAAEAARGTLAATYDLVIADEVQDLTEVQIELLRRLVREPTERQLPVYGGLFMTGDVNQVVSAAEFDARRLLRMAGDVRLERLSGNFRNPRAVADAVAAVSRMRAESHRLPARRVVEQGDDECFNASAGRVMWCVGASEDDLASLAGGAANIALLGDASAVRKLAGACPNAFTVEAVKGMEFDNVVLVDAFSNPSSRLDELFERGVKDASLHRAVNRLYVGVTRARCALLVAESTVTPALERFLELCRDAEHVQAVDGNDFDLDTTARGYMNVGLALMEGANWSAARANLARAVKVSSGASAGALTALERKHVLRRLCACEIYENNPPDTTDPARLADLLEEQGLYEEALPYARAALDDGRAAVLELARTWGMDGARLCSADRVEAFEAALERCGLDVCDLYGTSVFYDGLLDWYCEERRDDLELIGLEVSAHIHSALKALRPLVADKHEVEDEGNG